MSEQDENELRHALAEGLVSREEAQALREDAARMGLRPLDLLRARGRLSEDTYVSALRLLRPGDAVMSPPEVDVHRGARGVGVTEEGAARASAKARREQKPGAPPREASPAQEPDEVDNADAKARRRQASGASPREAAPAQATDEVDNADAKLQRGREPGTLPREAAPAQATDEVDNADAKLQRGREPGTLPREASPDHETGVVRPPPVSDAGEAATAEPPFPVPGWERYQPVRFLGQGGMGRVFLTWDPGLRRHVALKFVRGDEPELSRRFVAEARAQARVAHPRVCEVYEVGEVQGRAFIAMRYVDGVSLGALAASLSLEQKVLLVREAAEGVHAAHRAGLVHRDIKPANILVERSAEGVLSPFVMDFGLARDWKEGVTATGTVLGTPHYMSPEQARGEVARLDRRADVYSLGATLYALLTGQPPIPGGNGLEVLGNIATVEPRPPRALDRDIPVDLEAITLKCLEKDRSARYGSARELAEDLSRFLDGAPVLARTGFGYRARRWLRRHRRPVVVGTAGLLVVGLAMGQAVHARREVAAREALARRFTEQVERMDAQARLSGAAPRHDLREDRESLRARMRDIEAAMREVGPEAEGPGQYALGRGFLALDDVDAARGHLEVAWRAGDTSPRVAYALGLSLGQLYQRERLVAERQRDAKARDAHLAEVVRLYRDPARDFLRRVGHAEVSDPEYVAALLDFLEDRPEEARARLTALKTRRPWFHEAPLLLGDILVARGARRWNTGDREGALVDLDAGRAAYAQATDVGRSVPAVYRALARLEAWASLIALYGQGDAEAPLERGMRAVAMALELSSDDAEALELQAGFLRRQAEHRSRRGSEVSSLLEQAMASVDRALLLAPDMPRLHHERAVIASQAARHRQEEGLNPRDLLLEAEKSFARVPEDARDYDFHSDSGQVFRIGADHEEGTGGESLALRGRAIEASERAIALDATRLEGWLNLGTDLLSRAGHPQAPEADADLTRAVEALERARSINPGHVAAWFYLGEAHLARGARLRDSGEDPRPVLEAALAAYRQGLALNPALPPLHNGVGTALFEQAKANWERGVSPEPLLTSALQSFREAARIAPAQGFAQNNLGEVHAWHASVLVVQGESPSAEVRAARTALEEALVHIPGLAQPWVNLSAALLAEAEAVAARTGTPGPTLAEALRHALHADSLNPNSAQVWHLLGDLHALRALTSRETRPEVFGEAMTAYRRAMELEPAQPEHPLAIARLLLKWGKRQAPEKTEETWRRGLDFADMALSRRAAWPRARAVRAALFLELNGPFEDRSSHREPAGGPPMR
ncbi:protein kinase [Myxococcus sp. K15C18031901]|uniref:protein kinase domain-containing protein n=1 Tax=Myxococcus dinghuensis TaxID=2906761 RepID=UPI0020A8109C|nr:protein kinase [Myxococcus dinghuensis]MCP3103010.1 protein kinase [Myxococcus dinghuensis]